MTDQNTALSNEAFAFMKDIIGLKGATTVLDFASK